LKNFKSILKKSTFLNSVNSFYKSNKTKSSLKKIENNYLTLAKKNNITYDKQIALEIFKDKHLKINPNFKPLGIGELKIFWIGTNYNQDNSGFLQSLKNIADVTIFFNHLGDYGLWNKNGTASIYDAEVIKMNDLSLKNQIQLAINSGGIDVLIGQMWAGRLSKNILKWVRDKGIPIINISMDDRLPEHWGFVNKVRLGSVGLAENLDMVLTTSSESCLWYSVENCPAIYWPLASNPDLFYNDTDIKKDIDVLFIGNNYGIRNKIIKKIVSSGINVTTYGQGWTNGIASFEQSIKLSNRAKIILGIGTVGHCDDIYTLKLRDFDAPMSGALYITHRNPDLLKLFKEGHEVEFYETVEEAILKIKYYLENPNFLKIIAKNGQQKALDQHNWDFRLFNTFSSLGLIK
jgi:hypothetical protein